jgi:hypothetical protein
MATRETADSSINRKVAFASVASALGSITSLFLATFLLNLPFLAKMSEEDQGTLKTSLTAGATALITLVVGYYTRPGDSDGLKPLESSESTPPGE